MNINETGRSQVGSRHLYEGSQVSSDPPPGSLPDIQLKHIELLFDRLSEKEGADPKKISLLEGLIQNYTTNVMRERLILSEIRAFWQLQKK